MITSNYCTYIVLITLIIIIIIIIISSSNIIIMIVLSIHRGATGKEHIGRLVGARVRRPMERRAALQYSIVMM